MSLFRAFAKKRRHLQKDAALPLQPSPLHVRSRLIVSVGLAVSCFSACEHKAKVGYLKVLAPPTTGSFEIYRIANESPLQFVSEEAGHYNEDLALQPGSYLVLADCSSETIIIYPGQHASLVANRVSFTPPHQPATHDSFSIQCSRSDKTKSRQMIAGRYDLNILTGKQDLLVGMVPMHIDFSGMPEPDKPKQLSYRLSGLQVADFPGNRQEVSYFISPTDELIAATKYQQFGHWEFLLHGRYMVEVNGTRMQVNLAEGEERVIRPALLRVATSDAIDLEQPARIKGSPWLVEINGGHWLNFNETYPVLPGTATLSISGSTESVDVELTEGESRELQTRSITVDSGCGRNSGDAGNCMGERGVSLYLPEEPYPFIESVSDIPILFIDQESSILVGVEGSRDVLYEIPANVRDKVLALGYVKLAALPQHRPGQITDLVRVDSLNLPLSGHTLDINLERTTLMPLVVGSYKLDQFMTTTAGENSSRQNTSRNFAVEAGKTIDLEFPVFFSEKKYSQLKKKHPHGGDSSKPGDIGNYRHAPRLRML